jgi:hypothetical protein
MKISDAIGEMDLSNLTDEQIEVIIQLVWAAENGFDQFAETAMNTSMRHFRIKQANQCMGLRNRLGREKKNRQEAA